MSTTANTTHGTTVEPSPTNDKLARLAVEAGKYLDLQAGQRLPIEELYAQGKANGYSDSEIGTLLERDGLSSAEAVSVPEQGDLLGDLWQPSPTLDPFDLPDEFLTSVRASRAPHPIAPFRDWLERRRQAQCKEYDDGTYQHPLKHSYSLEAEKAKFARAKDVGRHFVKEHSTFTTVLITYAKPLESEDTMAEHAANFYPRAITRTRRRCLKNAGVFEEYAGVSLLAPGANAPTHAHDALWLPTFIPSETFDPLRRRDGVDVRIRYHRSENVSTPSAVNRQDLDRERGATTALAQEVGSNLPVLTAIEYFREEVADDSCENETARRATLDTSDCPKYVEQWCAHMRLGSDGDIETKGVNRWRELGRFKEIADSVREERTGTGETDPGAQADDLNQTERDFVEAYVSEVGDPSREAILRNVDANLGRGEQLGVSVDSEEIISGIRRRLDESG